MQKIHDPLQFFIAFVLTIIAIFSVANYLQNSQAYSMIAADPSLFLAQIAGARPRPTPLVISDRCRETNTAWLGNGSLQAVTVATDNCITAFRVQCANRGGAFTTGACNAPVTGTTFFGYMTYTRTCPWTCTLPVTS